MTRENGGQKKSGTPNIYCDSINKHEKKELFKDSEYLFIF